MNKIIKMNILLTGFMLIILKSAYADVPIGGATVMAFPLISLTASRGLAFIVAILIELLVLRQKLDLKFFTAGKLSLYANFFSTLAGFVIVIAYSSGLVFLICWILFSIFLFICLNALSEKAGFLKHFIKIKILRLLPFFAMGVIGYIFGMFLTPMIYTPSPFTKIISIIILIMLAFIITFLTEGYIIVKFHPENTQNVVSTVMLMNGISYIVFLPIFIFSGLDIVYK